MVSKTLNDSEKKLYDYIAKRRGTDVSIEELAGLFYDGKTRPLGWRGSIASTMRTLIMRSIIFGLDEIHRTSRLGPASKATYQIRMP